MSADILQFPNRGNLKNKSPSLRVVEQKNCQAKTSNKNVLVYVKKIIVRYGWYAPTFATFLLNRLKLREV